MIRKKWTNPLLVHYLDLAMKASRPNELEELVRKISASPSGLTDCDAAITDTYRRFTDTHRTLRLLLKLREGIAEENGVATPPPVVLPVLKTEAPSQPDNTLETEVIRTRGRRAPPTEPIRPLQVMAGSSADHVYRILDAAAGPVSYEFLRAEFLKTEMGKKMGPNDKPYYYGVQTLKNSGHCQLYKGKLWAHHHLAKFKEDVAAGRVEDLSERRFYSRWGEATMAYLTTRNDWVRLKDVVDHLSSLPEFAHCKDVRSQASVALRGLLYGHKLVEKRGRSRSAQWRVIRDGNGADDHQNSVTVEADASVVH